MLFGQLAVAHRLGLRYRVVALIKLGSESLEVKGNHITLKFLLNFWIKSTLVTGWVWNKHYSRRICDLEQNIFERHTLKIICLASKQVSTNLNDGPPTCYKKVIPQLEQTFVHLLLVVWILLEWICKERNKPSRGKVTRTNAFVFKVSVQLGIDTVRY